MDGTDCQITERKPYNRKYFSYKFNGPGLKYEIALSIKTGRILWVNGGVPCGVGNDLTLARSKFVKKLLPGEKAVADKGYKDRRYFITPDLVRDDGEFQKKIRAMHENINFGIKTFKAVADKFRHSLPKHILCFFAIVNLVQLKIDNGNPMAKLS